MKTKIKPENRDGQARMIIRAIRVIGGQVFQSSRGRALLAVALLLAVIAKAEFVPIPLTSASFNRDIVVENTALPAGGYTTASMDYGIANTAYSWYEVGFNAAA